MTVIDQIHKKALCGIIEVVPEGYFIASKFLRCRVQCSSAHTGEKTAKRRVLANFLTRNLIRIGLVNLMRNPVFGTMSDQSREIFTHTVCHRHRQYLKFKRGTALLFAHRMNYRE